MTRLGHGDLFHRLQSVVRGCLDRILAEETASDRPVAVIAHRGAALREAENTVLAFERALEEKADGIEVDVCVTRDGCFALWHDADPDDPIALLRQAGGEGLLYRPEAPPPGTPFRVPVRELTWEALQRHYRYRRPEADRTVPIEDLESLLDWAGRTAGLEHVLLDIKLEEEQTTAARALAERVTAVMRERGPRPAFHLLSPRAEIVAALVESRAAAAPPAPSVSADFELPGAARLAPRTGASEVSLGSGGRVWTGYLHDVREAIRARERGEISAVYAWTINDREKLERLVRAGADGILTDHPALLRQIVDTAVTERADFSADPGKRRRAHPARP
jgi:glycerophosphoryl diester phosphodiesterase